MLGPMTDERQRATLTWRVTPDLLSILDRDGRFVAVNPAWRDTLGFSPEAMTGASYADFVHADDAARTREALEQLRRGEPVLRFENRYRTAAGDHRWLEWVAVPEGGRLYCTARDVTENKDRVDRIAQQQAEAALREQFMAVLSHDLRNPLAAINAGASVLLRRTEDPKAAEILRQMQSSVGRMSELIANLMDLTRARLGGGIGIARAPVSNLRTGLERVIEEIRLVSPEVAITAHLDVGPDGACDGPRILQVVSNLLANAVSYGRPTEPIRVEALLRDGRLTVSVINKGDPIPEDVREKLFHPFFRSQSQQGLGLGLYIASEIARAHGGALSVASDARETRFTLDVPCGRDPP
jgi:PAS domain S-box-containing protein